MWAKKLYLIQLIIIFLTTNTTVVIYLEYEDSSKIIIKNIVLLLTNGTAHGESRGCSKGSKSLYVNQATVNPKLIISYSLPVVFPPSG